MNENEYLAVLNQVEYDLTFLRKRLRTLDFNIAVAETENNVQEANKLRRYRKQHERYIGYAKAYRKSLNSQYQEMLAEAGRTGNDC